MHLPKPSTRMHIFLTLTTSGTFLGDESPRARHPRGSLLLQLRFHPFNSLDNIMLAISVRPVLTIWKPSDDHDSLTYWLGIVGVTCSLACMEALGLICCFEWLSLPQGEAPGALELLTSLVGNFLVYLLKFFGVACIWADSLLSPCVICSLELFCEWL